MLEHAAGHRQGADAPRAGEDPRAARGSCDELDRMGTMSDASTHAGTTSSRPTRSARSSPPRRRASRSTSTECERCRERARWLSPGGRRPARVGAAGRAAAAACKRDLMETVARETLAPSAAARPERGASWLAQHSRPALALSASRRAARAPGSPATRSTTTNRAATTRDHARRRPTRVGRDRADGDEGDADGRQHARARRRRRLPGLDQATATGRRARRRPSRRRRRDGRGAILGGSRRRPTRSWSPEESAPGRAAARGRRSC